MIEMVLAIPFLAVVISALFFFGWSGRNRFGMDVAARLVAWAPVKHPEKPHKDRLAYDSEDYVRIREDFPRYYWADVLNVELLQNRFRQIINHREWPHRWRNYGIYAFGVPTGEGVNDRHILHDYATLPAYQGPRSCVRCESDITPTDYVGEVMDNTYWPGPMAEAMVTAQWPRNIYVELLSELPPPKGPWGRPSMRHYSWAFRDGREWRRREAGNEWGLTEFFQKKLDDELQRVAEPGTDVGEWWRSFYLQTW